MKGGVTYLDMEERKAAVLAVKRLAAWLDKESETNEVLSPLAVNTIRIVLAGRLPDGSAQ